MPFAHRFLANEARKETPAVLYSMRWQAVRDYRNAHPKETQEDVAEHFRIHRWTVQKYLNTEPNPLTTGKGGRPKLVTDDLVQFAMTVVKQRVLKGQHQTYDDIRAVLDEGYGAWIASQVKLDPALVAPIKPE